MATNALTTIETQRLVECESKIEHGLDTFVEVGTALLTIRDGRLYREEYKTFEDYCKQKWGMVSRQANRLIQSASVIENLRPIGLTLPESESQTRPLTCLSEEVQRQVWQDVIANAEEHKITALSVKEAVDRLVSEKEFRFDKKPHVSNNSGENEWYTPTQYIEAARAVLGIIELDPASSILANKTVKATKFYTKEDDGLSKEWKGKTWMNPPYAADLVGKFIGKYFEHVSNGDINEGIVLVNNATETAWFQHLVTISNAVIFPNSRIKFMDKEGNATGAPLQGQAILYAGKNIVKFTEHFGGFGWTATL
jgi:ParB family chromosome partitioning protein